MDVMPLLICFARFGGSAMFVIGLIAWAAALIPPDFRPSARYVVTTFILLFGGLFLVAVSFP